MNPPNALGDALQVIVFVSLGLLQHNNVKFTGATTLSFKEHWSLVQTVFLFQEIPCLCALVEAAVAEALQKTSCQQLVSDANDIFRSKHASLETTEKP